MNCLLFLLLLQPALHPTSGSAPLSVAASDLIDLISVVAHADSVPYLRGYLLLTPPQKSHTAKQLTPNCRRNRGCLAAPFLDNCRYLKTGDIDFGKPVPLNHSVQRALQTTFCSFPLCFGVGRHILDPIFLMLSRSHHDSM